MIHLDHAKLQVPKEKRSKRLYLTALSQANVYKQINHETLKTEQKYENTFLNILKRKEEYLRE